MRGRVRDICYGQTDACDELAQSVNEDIQRCMSAESQLVHMRGCPVAARKRASHGGADRRARRNREITGCGIEVQGCCCVDALYDSYATLPAPSLHSPPLWMRVVVVGASLLLLWSASEGE